MTLLDRALPWLVVCSAGVLGLVLLTGMFAYTNVEFLIAGHLLVLVMLSVVLVRRWQVRSQTRDRRGTVGIDSLLAATVTVAIAVMTVLVILGEVPRDSVIIPGVLGIGLIVATVLLYLGVRNQNRNQHR